LVMNYLSFLYCFCLFFLNIEAIPDVIPLNRFGLNTEGLDHSNSGQFFLVGSLKWGSIFRVNYDSTLQTLIPGNYYYGLFASSGIRLVNDIIHITNGVFPPSNQPRDGLEATYVQVNFTSQAVIRWINLTGIGAPGRHRAANDLDLDDNGNIYITDSYGAQIWLVDSHTSQASTFGLNGIVYHSNGYLLVGKSHSNGTSKGLLFRVNVADRSILQIPLLGNLLGVDGIAFAPNSQNTLYLAASGYLYVIDGQNDWKNAVVSYRVAVPEDCGTPSTITALGPDQVYLTCNQYNGYSSINLIDVSTGMANQWWWWFLLAVGLVLCFLACLIPYWIRQCGWGRLSTVPPRTKDAHVELQEQEVPEDASKSGRTGDQPLTS